jgi:excinuclease UvrABC helicase subunit UvrB
MSAGLETWNKHFRYHSHNNSSETIFEYFQYNMQIKRANSHNAVEE